MQNTDFDWVAWHRAYEDPSSPLSRRLLAVQEHLRRAIDGKPGRMRLISICAGEGRDVIGALADHPRRADVDARLFELDARNVAVARAAARAAGLDQVEVVIADASVTDVYEGAVPADIVLACGIFGNISDDDVRNTVEYLPTLCAPGAIVFWTRGREAHRDFAQTVKAWFAETGFEPVAFEAPDDPKLRFRLGVERLVVEPPPFERGVRLFSFLR
jgi:hypothetical protein